MDLADGWSMLRLINITMGIAIVAGLLYRWRRWAPASPTERLLALGLGAFAAASAYSAFEAILDGVAGNARVLTVTVASVAALAGVWLTPTNRQPRQEPRS